MHRFLWVLWFLGFLLPPSLLLAGHRVRDLGLTVGSQTPGKWNAITDVTGVRVGHATLSWGEGKLQLGKGPVRTGVTVILPSRTNPWTHKLPAGSFVLNGNGEAMGLMWIQESGLIETPIALTNTLSVANVQKGLLKHMVELNPKIGVTDDTLTPVVVECDDSTLNDIRGDHVKGEHVQEAIFQASAEEVTEGSVGAGTGMISYEFKAGIGTSSRVLDKAEGGYTIGVLLNANHGKRHELRFLDLPKELYLSEPKPKLTQEGSVVVVIATDAPLDGRQLSRLAKRAMLGIARTGAIAHHGSGDVAIAFSTANFIPHYPGTPTYPMTVLSDFWMNPVFQAVGEASEEALLNSLVASETTAGRDGNTVHGFPREKVQKWLAAKNPPLESTPKL